MDCPNYRDHRETLKTNIRGMNLDFTRRVLLGGGSAVALDKQSLVTWALGAYLQASGLLDRI